jgi:hypothetical protein
VELEHGISFNKPYVKVAIQYPNQGPLKNKFKSTGSSSSITMDTAEILIPLSVIGDDVFCVAMVMRTSNSPTEYEVVAPYPGAVPMANPFYWQEQERLAYFMMVSVKEFINQWKLKE